MVINTLIFVVKTKILFYCRSVSKGDKSRINALFRKALKRGLCYTSVDIDELILTVTLSLYLNLG